jgi:hypothetical protein
MKRGLDKHDEAWFLTWFRGWAQRTGISRNPDDPTSKYDFRRAYLEKAYPLWNEELKKWEWQPQYKIEEPAHKVDINITVNGVPQDNQEKAGADGV